MAFATGLLRHGCFDFEDMKKCANALRKEVKDELGGAAQPARNPMKKGAAKRARKLVKDAEKWNKWALNGWQCSAWQERHIKLWRTGELHKRAYKANLAHGYGKGVDKSMTREQAMMIAAFTNKELADYFNS